ncbi:chromate transporter [Candidatus Cryosericum odellii]|jgi:chromate transporter|uniref:Chromate transporter n=1 Tax=Candidatus Cryosericum odellii TaxID=2290917 RepID=A0A398DB16_9BACT|nr:chromate transporter [Candidatus Cryosericum odellii]RIE12612.1 chromate transporter [Candidatus Cryosericum odellii]
MEQKKFITYTAGHAPVRKQLLLFWIFFVIGAFTIGGGFAMILMMKRYLVDQYHWIKDEEYYDMLSISQVTPGPIAVNMATFVGYTQGGVLGSVLATLGVSIPAVAVIIIIAVFFPGFKDNVWVQRFFAGVIVGVVAQIATIVLDLGKRQKWTIVSAVVCAASLGILFFVHQVSPIWLILVGGLVGLAVEAFKPHEAAPTAGKRMS